MTAVCGAFVVELAASTAGLGIEMPDRSPAQAIMFANTTIRDRSELRDNKLDILLPQCLFGLDRPHVVRVRRTGKSYDHLQVQPCNGPFSLRRVQNRLQQITNLFCGEFVAFEIGDEFAVPSDDRSVQGMNKESLVRDEVDAK